VARAPPRRRGAERGARPRAMEKFEKFEEVGPLYAAKGDEEEPAAAQGPKAGDALTKGDEEEPAAAQGPQEGVALTKGDEEEAAAQGPQGGVAPTSPASPADDDDGDVFGEADPSGRKLQEPTSRASASDVRPDSHLAGRSRLGDKKACPQLLTGSQMNRLVDLQANRWLKIGRHPGSHILINNPNVSRNQCSIRWDYYDKAVELRVESSSGTSVNGKPYSLDRVILEHGDRVRVSGKTAMYDFILDLRPVGLGFGDPRQKARDGQMAVEAPALRWARMRVKVSKFNQDIRKAETDAFEFEREYYEIQARRAIRLKEMGELEERHKFYTEDTKRLERHLEQSRQDWLAKLDQLQEANEDEMRPLVQETASLQDRFEKLQLKKDELARSIHPERYVVSNLAVQELDFAPSARESGAEDDAFEGLSGLEDNRASGTDHSGAEGEDGQPARVAVPKRDLAPPPVPGEDDGEPLTVTTTGEDVGRSGAAAGDDDDEPLLPTAKRPRTGDGSEAAASEDEAPTLAIEAPPASPGAGT